MMNWFATYYLQIAAVLGVAIILGVGRAAILPAVRQHAVLLWLAFVVTAFCGLVLGWALLPFVAWLTSLPGLFGGVVGDVGALIALWFGWHAVALLVALVRDLADKQPDDDARSAALWVPTMLPVGWRSVWGVVTHPHGLGTGITAAIMAGITVVYAHRTIKSALKGRAGRKGWLWFASLVALLAGVVSIPLLVFLDGLASHYLPPQVVIVGRILLGCFGAALLIASAIDLKDKVPDMRTRAFLSFGLPILILFGSLAVGFLTSHANDGRVHVTTVSVR